jgi:hypothetical protein
VATLGVAVCHALILAVLVGFASGAGQVLEKAFDAQDVELPSLSILSINLCNFLVARWYVLAALLVPDAIAYFFLARSSLRWNWLASIWAMLPMLGGLALLGVMSLGFLLLLDGILSRVPAR